jgi:hypothetical protein
LIPHSIKYCQREETRREKRTKEKSEVEEKRRKSKDIFLLI